MEYDSKKKKKKKSFSRLLPSGGLQPISTAQRWVVNVRDFIKEGHSRGKELIGFLVFL